MKSLTEREKKKWCRQRHPRVTSVHPLFAQYRQQPTSRFTLGCVLTSGRVCLPVTQKPAVYRLNSTDEAARLIFRISTTWRKHAEGGRETRHTSTERDDDFGPTTLKSSVEFCNVECVLFHNIITPRDRFLHLWWMWVKAKRNTVFFLFLCRVWRPGRGLTGAHKSTKILHMVTSGTNQVKI